MADALNGTAAYKPAIALAEMRSPLTSFISTSVVLHCKTNFFYHKPNFFSGN